jgi:hypothetical protein
VSADAVAEESGDDLMRLMWVLRDTGPGGISLRAAELMSSIPSDHVSVALAPQRSDRHPWKDGGRHLAVTGGLVGRTLRMSGLIRRHRPDAVVALGASLSRELLFGCRISGTPLIVSVRSSLVQVGTGKRALLSDAAEMCWWR